MAASSADILSAQRAKAGFLRMAYAPPDIRRDHGGDCVRLAVGGLRATNLRS
jgi:hypothetical protein